MQIKRQTAVAVLKRLGYKTALSWTNSRLSERLNRIPSLVDDVNTVFNAPKTQRYVTKLITKVNDGEELVVIDGGTEDAAYIEAEAAMIVPPPAPVLLEPEGKKTNKSRKKSGFPAKNAKVVVRDRSQIRHCKRRPRIEISTELLINLREVGRTHEAMVEEANRIHMSGGGRNNIREAEVCHFKAVQVVQVLGLIHVHATTGMITPSPNVKLVRR